MPLKQTVAPTKEPVTLDMAKAHLRVDDGEEDALIAQIIATAREWCEDFQRRSYVTQTWRLTLDEFPCADEISIPRPPLASVSSITYVDTNGDTQTLATTVYAVDTDAEPGRVYLKYNQTWPSTRDITNAVTITFVAGYGADDGYVPAKVKQAMLLLIGHWFENREHVLTGTISKEIEFGVHALLWPNRVNVIG
jgi:uncharacterized phiE125 gp8 family phage protein